MTPTASYGNGLEPMLSTKTISKLFDCPMRTLRRAMAAGKFPRPDLKFGNQYRWKKSTVESFMANAKP